MEMSGTHPQDSMNFSPTIQTPVTMVTTLNNTSTTAVATSPVTTISATALVEILNSVASAVIPNSTLGDHHGNPHLQLQFQLPTTVDKTQTTTDGGEGEGEGQSNDGQKGKEKQPWHYHLGESCDQSHDQRYIHCLGGVRHCRVPLSAEIKEALEVAYVSRIMSKNFRKEGQPEKERIAQLTGLELDKVYVRDVVCLLLSSVAGPRMV